MVMSGSRNDNDLLYNISRYGLRS